MKGRIRMKGRIVALLGVMVLLLVGMASAYYVDSFDKPDGVITSSSVNDLNYSYTAYGEGTIDDCNYTSGYATCALGANPSYQANLGSVNVSDVLGFSMGCSADGECTFSFGNGGNTLYYIRYTINPNPTDNIAVNNVEVLSSPVANTFYRIELELFANDTVGVSVDDSYVGNVAIQGGEFANTDISWYRLNDNGQAGSAIIDNVTINGVPVVEPEVEENVTIIEGTGSGFARRPSAITGAVVAEPASEPEVVVERLSLLDRIMAWLKGLFA